MRDEFEEWYLALNCDFSRKDLCRLNSGDYFYTYVQAMWEQYQKIEASNARVEVLTKAMEHMAVSIANDASYLNDTARKALAAARGE